ncbi:hypothetical protein BDZ94DRAFT_1275017 [Collybia nuda]|uniref:MYND-type domain-containing protein n=1 Tax=Collybia nuda TaxID=64659 RepID=A0A9P6CC35_9AGAR|nr:hypothetical protein BDZ94DRAFT_1275017 [Collybia nuda]
MQSAADTGVQRCAKCGKNNALLRCSRCRLSDYCSSKCQSNDWANHKQVCIPENVLGVVIHCNAERRHSGIFESVNIGRSHEIYSTGKIAPVSKMVGHPLVVYRHHPPPSRQSPSLDNQIATYLMIETSDGFALPEWQNSVGTITVMRKDGKPLTTDAMEAIWMYHDNLLELFGDSADAAHRQMNRASFERFCKKYKK